MFLLALISQPWNYSISTLSAPLFTRTSHLSPQKVTDPCIPQWQMHQESPTQQQLPSPSVILSHWPLLDTSRRHEHTWPGKHLHGHPDIPDFSGCVVAAKGPGRHKCPIFSSLSTACFLFWICSHACNNPWIPFSFLSQLTGWCHCLIFIFRVEGAEWSEAKGALLAVGRAGCGVWFEPSRFPVSETASPPHGQLLHHPLHPQPAMVGSSLPPEEKGAPCRLQPAARTARKNCPAGELEWDSAVGNQCKKQDNEFLTQPMVHEH